MRHDRLGQPSSGNQRGRRRALFQADFARRFWRDRWGVVGVMAAIVLPVVLGFAALVIDYGYLTTIRNQLQVSAEAAVLAGVRELPSTANASTVAVEYSGKNMAVADHGNVLANADVVPGSWHPPLRIFTPGGIPLNAVRVTTRRAQANANPVLSIFASILGLDQFDVNTSAVAMTGGGDGVSCIIALNKTAPESLHVFGTADIEAVGCNVQVNSCEAAEAMWSHGTVDVVVTGDDDSFGYINVCGELSTNGPVNLVDWPYDETDYQEGDPFADWDPNLRDEPCDFTNYTFNGDHVLSPGVYCGGIRGAGSGTATFLGQGDGETDPVYVIKDGELDIGGQLAIEGDGVGFYMTGADANVDFKGSSDVTLSAATIGDLQGFVFAGDVQNPATDAHVLRGTPVGGMHGIVYFPEADVEVKGTSSGGGDAGSDCFILIADEIYFNGTSGLNLTTNNECGDYSGLDVFTMTLFYKLVD